jgi:hypothetical protein
MANRGGKPNRRINSDQIQGQPGRRRAQARQAPAGRFRRVDKLDAEAYDLPKGSTEKPSIEALSTAAWLEPYAIDEQINELPARTLADTAVQIMSAEHITGAALETENALERTGHGYPILNGALKIGADAAGVDLIKIAAREYTRIDGAVVPAVALALWLFIFRCAPKPSYDDQQ